ncbi:peptide chain release factor N(5)-glutamine methyltransferase [soil metagenome]
MPELTVRELWRRTGHGLGDRVTARWLCEVATGLTSDEFAASLDDPVTERMVAHLDAMLARHATGEPIQYVLGRWGFRHLDLAIDQRVLIPRPETEVVAGLAIELTAAAVHRQGRATVADLGTGSGAIGLSVAHETPLGAVTVWMTDRDPAALDVARANLAGLGRRGVGVRLAAGSWFEALPREPFDVIVSNPPYVAEGSPDVERSVTEWEPAGALFAGSDGLDHVRVLVAGALDRLVHGGWLVLEIGADQGDAVAGLFERHGYADIEIRPDLGGLPRIALGRSRAIG